jgi:hypothetical protein
MIVIYLVGFYLVVGFVFAVPFLTRWINRVDESAQGAPWTFKLTLLPGCTVFWPVLLSKCLKHTKNFEK